MVATAVTPASGLNHVTSSTLTCIGCVIKGGTLCKDRANNFPFLKFQFSLLNLNCLFAVLNVFVTHEVAIKLIEFTFLCIKRPKLLKLCLFSVFKITIFFHFTTLRGYSLFEHYEEVFNHIFTRMF